MIKKWLCSILIILLYGCGASLSSGKTHEFIANGKTWNLSLPEEWNILPLQEEVLFMAQSRDQNFVVLQRKPKKIDFKKQIIESAERDFFFFELIEESATTWIFKGQVRAALPIRTFEQKIYSEGDLLLLGSCSYETNARTKNDCKNIIKSWSPVQTS